VDEKVPLQLRAVDKSLQNPKKLPKSVCISALVMYSIDTLFNLELARCEVASFGPVKLTNASEN
jgi:hypothetical protein